MRISAKKKAAKKDPEGLFLGNERTSEISFTFIQGFYPRSEAVQTCGLKYYS
jgi:hypothetical protein